MVDQNTQTAQLVQFCRDITTTANLYEEFSDILATLKEAYASTSPTMTPQQCTQFQQGNKQELDRLLARMLNERQPKTKAGLFKVLSSSVASSDPHLELMSPHPSHQQASLWSKVLSSGSATTIPAAPPPTSGQHRREWAINWDEYKSRMAQAIRYKMGDQVSSVIPYLLPSVTPESNAKAFEQEYQKALGIVRGLAERSVLLACGGETHQQIKQVLLTIQTEFETAFPG